MFNRGSSSGLAGIAELTECLGHTCKRADESSKTKHRIVFSLLIIWHWSVGFDWKNEILFFIFPCSLGSVCGERINLEAVNCIPGSSNPSSKTLL